MNSWAENEGSPFPLGLLDYGTHIRGFTQRDNSGVTPSKRGTFAGLVEKRPYLKELGVTPVELMPILQFDLQDANYRAYMPLNLFAPHETYTVGHHE